MDTFPASGWGPTSNYLDPVHLSINFRGGVKRTSREPSTPPGGGGSRLAHGQVPLHPDRDLAADAVAQPARQHGFDPSICGTSSAGRSMPSTTPVDRVHHPVPSREGRIPEDEHRSRPESRGPTTGSTTGWPSHTPSVPSSTTIGVNPSVLACSTWAMSAALPARSPTDKRQRATISLPTTATRAAAATHPRFETPSLPTASSPTGIRRRTRRRSRPRSPRRAGPWPCRCRR